MHRSRLAFETWISAAPIEASLARLGEAASWPGQYADYHTQLAWEAWQAALAHDQGATPPAPEPAPGPPPDRL